MVAMGFSDAHEPYQVDGQGLPEFWLVVPASSVRQQVTTSAKVDARTGIVEIGAYSVAVINEDL